MQSSIATAMMESLMAAMLRIVDDALVEAEDFL